MAVWQICFYLIDRNRSISDTDVCYWDNEPDNVYNISFLPLIDGWSNDIIQYGDLQKTCIELLKENNKVIEISVRLDVRTTIVSQINCLVNYANSINAYVYYQGAVMIPSKDVFIKMIKQSDAYRFCKRPFMFISDISKGSS